MTGDSEMRSEGSHDDIDMEYYRSLVQNYIGLRRYKTALFWAEKICVMTENKVKDVYWMAQCMFLLKEYQRTAHIIKLHGYEKTHIFCFYLLVECYYESNDFSLAYDLLNSIDLDYLAGWITNLDATDLTATNAATLKIIDSFQADKIGPNKSELMASIFYLKGKILEAMDNRIMAMNSFIEALHLNVHCSEAFDALVQHEMLLASEERELVANLPFDRQCDAGQRKILERLYRCKLKKYDETLEPNILESLKEDNPTIQTLLDTIEKSRHATESDAVPKLGSRADTPRMFSGLDQTPGNLTTRSLRGMRAVKPSALEHLMRTPEVEPMEVTQPTTTTRISTTPQHTSINRSIQSDMISWDECYNRLDNSYDVITEKAASLFYECEYSKCVGILDKFLKRDPYHSPALVVLIGCLYEQQERSKLFCIAHKLVDLYSDHAISWYAVGCYYDLIGKSDPARRYLSKSTSIDRFFGPAWLSYGHSFAKENEHDQAMAAYFKATQLMRGCHLPLLYIGVECGLTKNFELSQKFFYQAMNIAPLDVFVLHELGSIKYENEKYEEAEELLHVTSIMVAEMADRKGEPIGVRWEPLYNNLGHCYRKNKKFDRALECYKYALSLKPLNPLTLTAMGLTYAVKNELDKAIDYLHRALALKRDDIVASALLKHCIDDSAAQKEFPADAVDLHEPCSSQVRNYQPISPNQTKIRSLRFDSSESDDIETLDMSMEN